MNRDEIYERCAQLVAEQKPGAALEILFEATQEDYPKDTPTICLQHMMLSALIDTLPEGPGRTLLHQAISLSHYLVTFLNGGGRVLCIEKGVTDEPELE